MRTATKETVEVSPAKEQVKINKRPVSLSDTTSAVDEASQRVHR